MRQSAIALVIVAFTSIPALAADGSSSELATGGLMFVRDDKLEMLSQDLVISPNEVRIHYRMLNRSDKDVTVLVSFPMPEISIEGADDAPSVPTEDPVNLLAAATTVNDKPVSVAVEQRVIAAGIDRTQLLRRLGIPLAPHLDSTQDALDRLPPDQLENLQRLGLAETEDYDAGGGMKKQLAPRWALQTTYFWEQTFPANSETAIDLRYQPSIGRSEQTLLGSPNTGKEPWYEELNDKYCFNYEFLAALERARKAVNGKFGAPFSEQRIEYAHKNWVNALGSPVREFRLIVDKGAADNLASFCGEEAKKISETQLEVTKNDYMPDDNLSILFLNKLPQQ
jgi:Domain of unknown function (DUF4424)